MLLIEAKASSIEMIPTLEPKAYNYNLLLAIWSPGVVVVVVAYI